MAGTTVDFDSLITTDVVACRIAEQYREWSLLREPKVSEWKELSKYLYATSTATTANAILPWSNTTTTPKLTQLMDNLHANYFAALFPRQKNFKFYPDDADANDKKKKDAVESYMLAKMRKQGYVDTMSELVYDYIRYGNCFALVDYIDESRIKETGEFVSGYTGPVVQRISPFDIVFNPTAAEFKSSPKIVRSIKTIGELAKEARRDPEMAETFRRLQTNRQNVLSTDVSYDKSDGFVADGFSNINQYYGSDYVEILTFYGDYYDVYSGELHEDRVVVVADRSILLSDTENPNWLGHSPIYHAGWRTRPDNLYAMGPLDNLVGMQYRIDHLENLKADVFDQIAYPMVIVQGEVEEFTFQPGERIYVGEEGSVRYLSPETTALNADFQIKALEDKMEELAGAPRQAMGIRTPGEKTAFEVQTLQDSSSRIFEHKAGSFDRTFIEPIINGMLEEGRRRMNVDEIIDILDEEGLTFFQTVTKADLNSNGKLVPFGARHFAERARRVQQINQLQSVKQADPSVAPHLSGKAMARILADEIDEPDLYGENIAIDEQLETQQRAQDAQVQNEEQLTQDAQLGI